jgi:F0F1-type ATP synthase membrane subunit a
MLFKLKNRLSADKAKPQKVYLFRIFVWFLFINIVGLFYTKAKYKSSNTGDKSGTKKALFSKAFLVLVSFN